MESYLKNNKGKAYTFQDNLLAVDYSNNYKQI